MNDTSDETHTLNPFQNPYHPFEETERYRAFQEGWNARKNGEARTQNPFALSEFQLALAWLDGWTMADWAGRNDVDGTGLGQRRGREASRLPVG